MDLRPSQWILCVLNGSSPLSVDIICPQWVFAPLSGYYVSSVGLRLSQWILSVRNGYTLISMGILCPAPVYQTPVISGDIIFTILQRNIDHCHFLAICTRKRPVRSVFRESHLQLDCTFSGGLNR